MSYLAVQKAEAHFGAVDHSAVVLYVDAALFPSTNWVVGERRGPLMFSITSRSFGNISYVNTVLKVSSFSQ